MKVAYLAPEFGALTSTFIYREVEALRGLGLDVLTYSTMRPKDKVVSDEAREIVDQTLYLYELPKGRIVAEATVFAVRHFPAFLRAKWLMLRDAMAAEVSQPADRVKMIWHFIVGCALAGRLKSAGVQHIHAHFAHVPTAIAMYAGLAAGIPFSFTNHANDIFQRPVALREKVGRSAFTACISQYNVAYLAKRGCDRDRMRVIRCALDVAEYAYEVPRPVDDGAIVFAVGRLVEKKGITYLVEAARILKDRGRRVHCKVAGDGPLKEALQKQVQEAQVADVVDFVGSQPQENVRRLLRTCHVFALPCVEAADGDIDGIPVSLMEAMAMGVPVVSTGVSGIPELIQDGENGLLARPRDAASLADAIERLMSDQDDARRLAEAARRTIETEFEQMRNAKLLKEAFEASGRGGAAS